MVDRFHLAQLANAAVTEVRRRVTLQQPGGADAKATGNGNYATGSPARARECTRRTWTR
ncbi:transposase [Streptantibioticus cattleyicolor]|uniref:transposase n=1 Tax=Streptantibioticus cattleyicolor TaxID=29303 RepID=UPI000A6C2F71|nr:transposase [Streptantibioticus cattleyicolor]